MNEELQSKLLEVVDKTGQSIEFISEQAIRAVQIEGIVYLIVIFIIILFFAVLCGIIFNGKDMLNDGEPTARGYLAAAWCVLAFFSSLIILVESSGVILRIIAPAGYLVIKVLT